MSRGFLLTADRERWLPLTFPVLQKELASVVTKRRSNGSKGGCPLPHRGARVMEGLGKSRRDGGTLGEKKGTGQVPEGWIPGHLGANEKCGY